MEMLSKMNSQTYSKIKNDMAKLNKENKMLKLQNMNSHVIAYNNRKENKLYAVNDHKKFINNADPLIEKLELIYSKLKNTQDFHILYDDTLLMVLVKDTVKMDQAAAMSLICLIAESIKKRSKKVFGRFATKLLIRITYKIK